MNLLGFIMSLVHMQAVHGWLSAYERLVNSQNFFSPYLTQEDLSRLGRNYIEVGRLMEEFFPEHDIRLVFQLFQLQQWPGQLHFYPLYPCGFPGTGGFG